MLRTLLWGNSEGPHTYVLVRWLFLRLLGVIYLIAFGSLGVQMLGLVGSSGILPAANFLAQVETRFPSA
jgi:lipase maturation factor 1